LAQVDHAIATWIREYAKPGTSDWAQAENSLLRILLDLAIIEPEELTPVDGESDVVANALARALGNTVRSAHYSTDYLATLSALAFAAAGNFASASVLAQRASQNKEPGPAEHWMMQVLAEPCLRLSEKRPPFGLAGYAQLTDHALESGAQDDFGKAAEALDVAFRESFEALTRTDRYLLLFWRQIHRRFEELSVARVLRDLGFPNQAYISELVGFAHSLFYPSQARTLREQPIVQSDEPVLITLPTSAGKSLLGEIALVDRLSSLQGSRRLAVYLAPYRALTDQLQRRMKRRLQKGRIGIQCEIRRGGYLADTKPIDVNAPTIVVATPEAFDALLRLRPELYERLAACVFDEFHLIEQQDRGLRYEGLLGRILCGATGDRQPKIVALSAVIKDAARITDWLRIKENSVAQLSWRPATRRLAIADAGGHLTYFSPDERLPGHREGDSTWSGELDQSLHKLTVPSVNYASIWKEYNERVAENVAKVAVEQWERFQQPVLVLASSRDQTKRIAHIAAANLPPVDKDTQAFQLADQIHSRFSYLHTLQRCLAHQTAYHNASLPDWVRSKLEGLIDGKGLRIVTATTTLAEGVDLPFRVVVFADWRFFIFGKQQPMPKLLFQNIAGRCGRAWKFIEGDTIIVDIPDKKYSDYPDRYREYMKRYVIPSPYPLRSSVEKALRSGKRLVLDSTIATLESQFTAHLGACPPSEEIEQQFAHALYASSEDRAISYIGGKIVQLTEDMISEPSYPVMERRSPLKLTKFGEVALQTGLSPRSAITLAHFVRDFVPPQEPGKGKGVRDRYNIKWEPTVAAMWKMVCGPSRIQELESGRRRSVDRRNRPVKTSNFVELCLAWTSGKPIELIAFLALGTKSERRPKAQRWLSEEEPNLTQAFEEEIEQIAVFCTQYLGGQWSWIFRGASTIAEHLNAAGLAEEMTELSTRLQYGVKYLASADMLKQRCPVDRAKLDWLIESFILYTFTPLDAFEVDRFLEWLLENHEWLAGQTCTPFSRTRVNAEDLDELRDFLRDVIGQDRTRPA
jgi:helicase